MAVKVFIDGKEGTTGLKIFERFASRNDLEILEISEEKRMEAAYGKRRHACDHRDFDGFGDLFPVCRIEKYTGAACWRHCGAADGHWFGRILLQLRYFL